MRTLSLFACALVLVCGARASKAERPAPRSALSYLIGSVGFSIGSTRSVAAARCSELGSTLTRGDRRTWVCEIPAAGRLPRTRVTLDPMPDRDVMGDIQVAIDSASFESASALFTAVHTGFASSYGEPSTEAFPPECAEPAARAGCVTRGTLVTVTESWVAQALPAARRARMSLERTESVSLGLRRKDGGAWEVNASRSLAGFIEAFMDAESR